MAAKKKPAPKRGASRYQAPAKQPIPGWLWMAIGLTVGAFIVFLMKLEPGKGSDSVKREKIEAAESHQDRRGQQDPAEPDATGEAEVRLLHPAAGIGSDRAAGRRAGENPADAGRCRPRR